MVTPKVADHKTKTCSTPEMHRIRSDSKSFWVCDICRCTIPENEVIHLHDGEAYNYPYLDGHCKHEEKTLYFVAN